MRPVCARIFILDSPPLEPSLICLSFLYLALTPSLTHSLPSAVPAPSRGPLPAPSPSYPPSISLISPSYLLAFLTFTNGLLRATAAAAITTPKPPANRRAGAGPSKDVRGESRNLKALEDVYGPGVFSKQSAWCSSANSHAHARLWTHTHTLVLVLWRLCLCALLHARVFARACRKVSLKIV